MPIYLLWNLNGIVTENHRELFNGFVKVLLTEVYKFYVEFSITKLLTDMLHREQKLRVNGFVNKKYDRKLQKNI